MKRNSRKGFTLLELLLVVIIVGILASVALPRLRIAADQARETEAMRMLDALFLAEIVYYQENDRFITANANIGDLMVTVPQMRDWNAPTLAAATQDALAAVDITITANHGGAEHTHRVVGRINAAGRKLVDWTPDKANDDDF